MRNELNENIRDEELLLLDQELKLNEAKLEYDKAVFSESLFLEKEYSETKNKELSTIPKRECIVRKKDHIKQLKQSLDDLDIKIRKDKINLKYLERKFRIELKYDKVVAE